MEGVGTSTAGFIGLAERGPVGGVPVLVTNFADYKRKFGGYLSASEFGDYRFLAYCVEHFFLNGGSRAYISRCVPADAKVAKGSIPEENPVVNFYAANPGQWGDDITAILTPASKAKTQILEQIDDTKYRVKKSVGFENGDVVVLEGPDVKQYNVIVKSLDNVIEFAQAFDEECVDTNLVPQTTISTCEFNLEVKYDDVDEFYGDVSFNINSSNYLLNKVTKSALIRCEVVSAPEGDPFLALSSDGSVATVAFKGGSNGSKSAGNWNAYWSSRFPRT